MPIVSFIVPVYNAEKYIDRCIQSILSQKITDFELLLIDDGSKDQSGKICDDYSLRDNRVKVYHKENGGVSSARNVGLDNAKGDWITFCDADDWISDAYLENLLSHVDDGIDLVFSYASIVYSDNRVVKEHFPAKRISLEEIQSAFVENAFHNHSSPWSKLYKNKLIQDIKLRFCEEMHIGEDALFLYSYLLNCRYMYISNDTDYFYNYQTEGSLTKRVNRTESEIVGYEKITSILKRLYKEGQFTNPIAIHKVKWIEGYYVRRVLNSLYHNPIDREKRLRILKNLNINSYIDELVVTAIKEKILVFLLRYKCYFLYDSLRTFIQYYYRRG